MGGQTPSADRRTSSGTLEPTVWRRFSGQRMWETGASSGSRFHDLKFRSCGGRSAVSLGWNDKWGRRWTAAASHGLPLTFVYQAQDIDGYWSVKQEPRWLSAAPRGVSVSVLSPMVIFISHTFIRRRPVRLVFRQPSRLIHHMQPPLGGSCSGAVRVSPGRFRLARVHLRNRNGGSDDVVRRSLPTIVWAGRRMLEEAR